jgi:hypothetical protein
MALSPDLSPEKRLLAAYLHRAIRDLTEPADDILDIWRQDAIEWLYNNELRLLPFTFSWTCQELDLPTETILAHIETKGIIYPRKWRVEIGNRGKTARYYSLAPFCPYYPIKTGRD